MKETLRHGLLATLAAIPILLGATFVPYRATTAPGLAFAEANAVTFPAIEEFVHYTTVERGDSVEHMMTSRQTLAALKAGEPVPIGTHMVLVDYRNGQVFRYFVSQKVGEGAGDWAFQWFHPDRSIKADENTARCYSCHRAREASQFMFTLPDAQDFDS